MSNPEMKGARILRFHTSDKVFHSINAICWYALVITGAIVYFGHWMGDISDETVATMQAERGRANQEDDEDTSRLSLPNAEE